MLTQIAVLFGGNSCEHEISIISALQVMHTLKEKYEVIPIYISKQGSLYSNELMFNIEYFKQDTMCIEKDKVLLIKDENILKLKKKWKHINIDLCFPIMHGTCGEDGSIQGYLTLLNVPYVGNSISSSAIAQSKILTKQLLELHQIPQLEYNVINKQLFYNEIYPCIIKPNKLGSSIGIQVVLSKNEYVKAVQKALQYDEQCIVEPYIKNFREINCSVLKKEGKIYCSNLEEVSHNDNILSFSDKYEAANKLGEHKRNLTPIMTGLQQQQIYDIAEKVYHIFEFRSVIRIDFMVIDDKVYVNEVNSIPGSYAYYLWDYSFIELLELEIKEAIHYFMMQENLITSFESNVLCSPYGFKNK